MNIFASFSAIVLSQSTVVATWKESGEDNWENLPLMQSLICDRVWVPFRTIDRQIIHSIKFAIEKKRVQ